MSVQLGFYVDLNACTGCKACQVACKDKWNHDVGETWRRVVEYSGGDWIRQGNTYQQNIFAYYVSMACNHCVRPICEEVCPTGAIYKRTEDGLVMVDEDRCIGCRYCEWACPYACPQINDSTGKMTKCNFCYDYLEQGLPPACVSSCPSRALEFGPLNELHSKYGAVNAVAPMPEGHYTSPALVFKPHKDSQPGGAGTGEVSNPKEI